ncbi:response regulator [Ramlibacter terrae]|uniref:Response regulator n=1 Tax=Ramlibacter terrae TaxID=2732511 RepID=A0ABX6P5A9_9BURK|nr:response regulator [Ramlibacter terrae]
MTAFTAHDDDPTRQRCLDLGFDLYLSKPASREEVMAVLRGRQPAPVRQPAAIEPALVALVPQFPASRLQLARKLAGAAAQGERETIRTTAHQLAGSLAMYGFAEASRASMELERAAPAGELQDLQGRCAALVELLAQALPASKA